jgi:hypothetical protein
MIRTTPSLARWKTIGLLAVASGCGGADAVHGAPTPVAQSAASTAPVAASPLARFSHDPEASRIVTSDIDHFWRAFDDAPRGDATSVFQAEYLDAGSPGLHDFVRARIGSARELAEWIGGHPGYYASIRTSTQRIASFTSPIRESFRRLKALYPDAVFPDVYFVVGRMTSGGTVSDRGLLIGAEMYGRTPEAPAAELSKWHQQVLKSVDQLPGIVAHELTHIEQKDGNPKTLLGAAFHEGSADFIGELISGFNINGGVAVFGVAHERELWEEMRPDLHGANLSKWLYNGDGAVGRPADLGYFIGYRIAKAYYDRATDKAQAIRDILEVQDYDAFLAKSGYDERMSGDGAR